MYWDISIFLSPTRLNSNATTCCPHSSRNSHLKSTLPRLVWHHCIVLIRGVCRQRTRCKGLFGLWLGRHVRCICGCSIRRSSIRYLLRRRYILPGPAGYPGLSIRTGGLPSPHHDIAGTNVTNVPSDIMMLNPLLWSHDPDSIKLQPNPTFCLAISQSRNTWSQVGWKAK